MFPVYARESVIGSRPICIVTEYERRELILNGSAKPVSNGEAIKLLLNLEQFRGVSAQMGPHVTIRAASGSQFHKAIAEAYMTAGSHCPLVLKSVSA
jgi:hypothetical protein